MVKNYWLNPKIIRYLGVTTKVSSEQAFVTIFILLYTKSKSK